MQVISDYFQETAYRLGYRPQDLLPITRQSVEAQSYSFTKGMGDKQKDYYINKKVVTLVQRQNKIMGQVQRQIKKRELSFKVAPSDSKLHNPVIVRLLNEHQKIIQRNIKFLDTLQRKQEIESRKQQRLSVSSSNSRKTERDLQIKPSSISRRSNKSAQSSKSSRSSASSKEKLQLVRSRQKEQQLLKKQLYKERQAENSRKSLRAEEEALKKSQRARTRLQINKQIVDENKKDLRFMHNTQIKDHFERLKFKLQKTEQIRAKNAQRRQQRQRSFQYQIDRIQHKKQSQEVNKKQLALRFDDKFRTASLRIQNQQILRKEARNYNRLTQSLKTANAKKNREIMEKQQHQFAAALRINEKKRLQTAQLNRYSLTGQTRMKHISQEVRQEVARKNLQGIKNRRYLQSEAVQRKLIRRFQKFDQFQTVKHKLQQQRGEVIRQLNMQRRSLDARKQKTKFNSFFDI